MTGFHHRLLDPLPYSLYSKVMKPTQQPLSKGAEEARQHLEAVLGANPTNINAKELFDTMAA